MRFLPSHCVSQFHSVFPRAVASGSASLMELRVLIAQQYENAPLKNRSRPSRLCYHNDKICDVVPFRNSSCDLFRSGMYSNSLYVLFRNSS